MYNIINESDIIYVYSYRRQRFIFSGVEKDLIKFLATTWRKSYSIFDEKSYYSSFLEDYNEGYYIAYDNMYRLYNLNNYKHQSYVMFQQNFHQQVETKNSYCVKNKKYTGIYRQTPVEGIHKTRGGPSRKKPRTKHIFMMYDNPEYKEFNRGSKKLVPSWWDDSFRHVDKCWKSQRKARHQWKEKEE